MPHNEHIVLVSMDPPRQSPFLTKIYMALTTKWNLLQQIMIGRTFNESSSSNQIMKLQILQMMMLSNVRKVKLILQIESTVDTDESTQPIVDAPV